MVGMGDVRGVSKKAYLALTMAAAVVFIMGAILWFSRAQAAPVSDSGRVVPAGRPPALLIKV